MRDGIIKRGLGLAGKYKLQTQSFARGLTINKKLAKELAQNDEAEHNQPYFFKKLQQNCVFKI